MPFDFTLFTNSRKSFYINSDGPDHDAVRGGLLWLLDQSKMFNGGFIAVPTIQNLDGLISDIFGFNIVKNLKKYGKTTISGITISLITDRKMIHSVQHKPIFVLYADKQMLDKIDSMKDIKNILVFPWMFNEIENWIATWNATELGKSPSKKKEIIENPVVVQALKNLTSYVNLSTGIAHPQDRSATIWAFKILKQNHENFLADEIKSWLISQGHWRATAAEDATVIARGVLNGKSFRSGTRMWRKDIINIWREKAEPS